MAKGQFDWDAEGNLTPMGQVDSVGRFARGAARRGRRPRGPWVWVAVAIVVVGAVVLLAVGLLTG